MTRRTMGVLGALVTLACGLVAGPIYAGAAAPPPRSGEAASLNACKLLTVAEVATVIGEPVASAKGGKSATGAAFCNWTGQDSRLLSKGISVIAARDHAKQRFSQYKNLLSPTHPVKGVGDAAATDGKVLIARKGDRRFLFISPLYKSAEITVDALKPLATKVLGRLK